MASERDLRPGYVQPSWGVRVAVEMGDSHLGLEHALLAMIRDRETAPARALAGPADLDMLDAAVVEAATFGFNSRAETGETWIHVFGPGGNLGREVSREVLDTALLRLGRTALSS